MKSHQELNQQYNYYYQDPIIGAGLNLLLPNGSIIRERLENRIRELLIKNGYSPLYSPHIGNQSLFEKSGHYPYYKDSMYEPIKVNESSYLIKPMNCPFHILAYKSQLRSYRELPVKYFEFGNVYRMEDAGAINGLLRARSFVQDDGHLFVSREQVSEQIKECISLLKEVMGWFGFVPSLKLSIREESSEKYIGAVELWKEMEDILSNSIRSLELQYSVENGGAAFYGPKIDFNMVDNQNRSWQLGTIQLDFNLPERFDLKFKNAKGVNERPVLIHRALLGSIERFMAILIEQYQGKLPFWIAPIQIAVICAKPESDNYSREVYSALSKKYRVLPHCDGNIKEQIKNAFEKGAVKLAVAGPNEEKNRSISFQENGLKVIKSIEDENYGF